LCSSSRLDREPIKQSYSGKPSTLALTDEPHCPARRVFPPNGVNVHDEITEFQDSLLIDFHDRLVLYIEVMIV
jgi:hypothetical protein